MRMLFAGWQACPSKLKVCAAGAPAEMTGLFLWLMKGLSQKDASGSGVGLAQLVEQHLEAGVSSVMGSLQQAFPALGVLVNQQGEWRRLMMATAA
jgi:hypothetical protein